MFCDRPDQLQRPRTPDLENSRARCGVGPGKVPEKQPKSCRKNTRSMPKNYFSAAFPPALCPGPFVFFGFFVFFWWGAVRKMQPPTRVFGPFGREVPHKVPERVFPQSRVCLGVSERALHKPLEPRPKKCSKSELECLRRHF